MTYEDSVKEFIFRSVPITCSARCESKLTGYALNTLRVCGHPSPDSVEFETIINGIVNAAIIGGEENI